MRRIVGHLFYDVSVNEFATMSLKDASVHHAIDIVNGEPLALRGEVRE